MKIEDNFLDQKEFAKLQTLMMGHQFPWLYYDGGEFKHTNTDYFMFTHMFYLGTALQSTFCENLRPILEKIDPISIRRIKANLLTKTLNIIEKTFHFDMPDTMSEEKLKQWTTSIFYINTNNGYTEFQDGRIAMENTIVKSVANRMVTFPGNLRHRGTSCTDEKMRIVINFNYFK